MSDDKNQKPLPGATGKGTPLDLMRHEKPEVACFGRLLNWTDPTVVEWLIEESHLKTPIPVAESAIVNFAASTLGRVNHAAVVDMSDEHVERLTNFFRESLRNAFKQYADRIDQAASTPPQASEVRQ